MKEEDCRERILPLVQKDTDIYNQLGRNKYIQFWQGKFDEINDSLSGLEDLNKSEAINQLRKIENIKRNIGGFIEFISDIKHITFDKEISRNDFDTIYSIVNPSDGFLGEYKDIDVYFVLNIPRTIHEKVMTWWKQESAGYTHDIRYAKIFSREEILKEIKSVDWEKKFAAIPIEEVSVKLGQNYIPFNWNFKNILLQHKDKILGNKKIHLSKEEIEYLI